MAADLDRVYGHRFTEAEAEEKHAIWRVLGAHLQRYLVPGAVLDIACDRGYFIENVVAAERWATDVRDVADQLSDGIRFVQADGLELDRVLPNDHFGTAFMSNYLEHLPSSDAVLEQFAVVRRLLRTGGRMVVLQPNVSLLGGAYWDFIDHKVALNEKSLVEATELVGLKPVEVVRRFLPYTTKSALPQHPALVRAYLAVRPLWWLLGKQTLLVAERPD
jgi:ubiquinone/menaquinone biosynthesis C-methylase UbiE